MRTHIAMLGYAKRPATTHAARVQAIYITLLIVLAFVVLAIFDTNRLQRTWTGLSASLLSFSFIFGNSIRQAPPPSSAADAPRAGAAACIILQAQRTLFACCTHTHWSLCRRMPYAWRSPTSARRARVGA